MKKLQFSIKNQLENKTLTSGNFFKITANCQIINPFRVIFIKNRKFDFKILKKNYLWR